MINFIFGYLFVLVGFLILALPLILVELSRPRDWLIGGLFLVIGLFLLVENDFFRGSINLFVISITTLFGILMSEIIQTRWYQLSFEEKNRIRSFERWVKSFNQLGQIFALIGNGFLNVFKGFSNQSKKPLKEKKWVRSEIDEDIKKKVVDQSDSTFSNKIINKELTEKEETS